MALLPIYTYPHPVLREKSKDIATVDAHIQQLAEDMVNTMYKGNGIGLAANQIGVNKRIFVTDCSSDKKSPMVFINPVIIHKAGEKVGEEGCLSMPGIYAKVKRAEQIVAEYLNEKGEKKTIEAKGLLAVCIQHEIDHLDGVLFFDYLSSVKRTLINGKLKRLERQTVHKIILEEASS